MSFHEVVETDQGLQLMVEGSECALIRERGGCLDLIWQVRGPKDLVQSRHIVAGLLDLLVVYDSLQTKEKR